MPRHPSLNHPLTGTQPLRDGFPKRVRLGFAVKQNAVHGRECALPQFDLSAFGKGRWSRHMKKIPYPY